MPDSCGYSKELSLDETSLSESLIDQVSEGPIIDERDGVFEWECPHPSRDENSQRCVFHIDKDSNDDVGAQEVQEQFISRLNSSDSRSNQFIGASIPRLDLAFQTLETKGKSRIIIDHSNIGYLNLEHASVNTGLYGNNVVISSVSASDAKFDGPIDFQDSVIGVLNLFGAELRNRVFVTNSTLGLVIARHAKIDADFEMASCLIEKGATFEGSVFESLANFYETTFKSEHTGTKFDSREEAYRNMWLVRNPLQGIRKATTDEQVPPDGLGPDQEKPEIYFTGRAFADSRFVHFSDIEIHGADFRRARFRDEARFNDCTFDFADFSVLRATEVSFIDANIFGVAFFSGVRIERGLFRFCPIDFDFEVNNVSLGWDVNFKGKCRVFFDEGRVEEGRLMQPDDGETYYDVQGATLGDVTVTPRERAFELLIIAETDFDGFDFPTYRDSLTRENWVIDEEPLSGWPTEMREDERREVTYLKAKQGAAEVGDPLAESKFFRREMRYRIGRYKRNISPDSSYLDFYKMLGKAATNQLYRFSTGYGESPSRVVLSYVSLTLAISALLVFPLMAENPNTFVDASIKLSQILLIGSAEELPAWLQPVFRLFDRLVLPAFVALLVFTLSRSVER